MARSGSNNSGGMILGALGVLLLFAGLYAAQTYSYLLFHSLVEIFSVAVAAALFMLAWNSRHFANSRFLLWIGIGYLFVGMLDLVHTLVYRGMGVFGDLGTDPPTQLWIAARFMQALVLLTAPLFFRRKFRPRLVLGGFFGITTLVLLSVFVWDIFPSAFDDAAGALTPFKIISEYIICGILLLAAGWLLAWRDRLDGQTLALLVGSIGATLVSELSFTLYTDPYGVANLIGHVLKLIAFYLLYRAVVERGLRRPYDTLFRDLKLRKEQLQDSQDELLALNETLEQRVVERTAHARALTAELTQAESRERERLATILHDDLQQTLVATRMRVKMAASSSDAREDLLGAADRHLGEAIELSRSLAVEVSPAIVHEQGLGNALKWLGDHMNERHDLIVDVEMKGDVSLGDPDVEAVVFRVVRELLFNVVKHAGVKSACVRARVNGDAELLISVSDGGRGFNVADLQHAGGKGFGLGNILNRVEMLGGSCDIDSAPGEGTHVVITVPFSEQSGGSAAPPSTHRGLAPSTPPRPSHRAR